MIRGLLLDSGDTMIGPRGGRWNPRFDFEDVVSSAYRIDSSALPAAFDAGQVFLQEASCTPSREAYHRVVLAALGIPDPADDILEKLEYPLPSVMLVEVFPDVVPMLTRWDDEGLGMVVVSNNWATLPALYDDLGLGHFFKDFVISEVLGCEKPDPRMYAAGHQALGLEPGDCMFVDDDPDFVRAAQDLGCHAVAIDRNGRIDADDLTAVSTFDELVEIMANIDAG